MTSNLRYMHARVDEDLLKSARKEAERRGITYSDLFRRALEAELEYPGLVTEIRRLRKDVNRNRESIGKVVEVLDKDVENIVKSLDRDIKNIYDSLEKHLEVHG